MARISFIGAGSVVFAFGFVRDLCITKSLWGSSITLMDIDEERLNLIHKLATSYSDETKAELQFKKTTSRKEALEGADFVISTVKVGMYDSMEAEREISERYGYYRGIGDRVCDYYGGIGAYYQLRFFLDLARDMEKLCPYAWLIETANPVFEGINLITRETEIRAVGVCHGHFGYKGLVDLLDLKPEDVRVQMAGFNHCIWLTHFMYKGKDAYSLLNDWIENKAEKYWKSEKYLKSPPWKAEVFSPGAVDMYKKYGLYPIGDTVRSVSPYWHHIDLKTKQKWYGPTGGFDSEIGWSLYLSSLEERSKKMRKLADDSSVSLIDEYPPSKSGEQHIIIIDAIANDKESRFQLNIPNNGAIAGIPDDVAVEIPVIVSGRGVQGIQIGELPKDLMLDVMIPRMRRMEQILQAFKERDRKGLLLQILEDYRSKSFEHSKELLEEILAQPWNAEAADHYQW